MRYSTSKLGFLVSMASLTYFVMVMSYLASEWQLTPQAVWIYKKLEGYEHFMMIAQINMSFQLISLLLHIFGHFARRYRKSRDFVFANLAFPFSVSTMVSFWTFWFLIGKKRVFPQDGSILYPLWVTHGFHTLSPATNMVLLYAHRHDYGTNPYMFSYCFSLVYFLTACLMYAITGSFKKAYIEKFTKNETAFYYCAFAVFAHFCYMCGLLANNRLFRTPVSVGWTRGPAPNQTSPPQPRPPTNPSSGAGRRVENKND